MTIEWPWTDLDVSDSLDRTGFYRPTPWETAVGQVAGTLAQRPARHPERAGATDPRLELESALRVHLTSTPCVVAFSGGVDSSVLLALATHVASRDGLAPPVAVTHDMAGVADAEETEHQRLVIEHLSARYGPIPWVRLPSAVAFDLVGEVAGNGLREHGLLWPALVHSATPIWAEGRGGVVITGEGGDEVLSGQRATPFAYLGDAGRRRRRLRQFGPAAVRELRPRRWRERDMVRRLRTAVPEIDWLHPAARERSVVEQVAILGARPIAYGSAIKMHRRERGFALGLHNTAELARRRDVTMAYPFFDRRFIDALAHLEGWSGPGSRLRLVTELFADLLPEQVLKRRTKARFHNPAFGPATRAFVNTWDGRGLEDLPWVAGDRLRAHWLSDRPWAGSLMLLQLLWLGRCE